MPTGYTYNIKDGISFSDFVMNCAKNFGACITMRDMPADTPIPDEFEVTTCYEINLKKAELKLAKLKNMTNDEIQKAYADDYAKRIRRYQENKDEKESFERALKNMLKKVELWNPPTEDHVGLREFMKKQILETIDFDCNKDYLEFPKECSATTWHEENIEMVLSDIEYYKKAYDEEVNRVAERNKWIKNLRESLTCQDYQKMK